MLFEPLTDQDVENRANGKNYESQLIREPGIKEPHTWICEFDNNGYKEWFIVPNPNSVPDKAPERADEAYNEDELPF